MMLVSEIMTDRAKTISPEATLQEAASLMDDQNIGALPVLDGSAQLIGIITDRDIVVRAISAGLDPRTARVSEAMTSPAVYCHDFQPVREAARIMERERVRRLPVVDRNLRLVGILSLEDLLADLPDRSYGAAVAKALSIPIKAAS